MLNHKFSLKNAFQEIFYRIDNWVNKGFRWIVELIEFPQPARDVLGTSSEGLVKVLTSGTSRGPLEDSYWTNKKLIIWWKKCFLYAIVLSYTSITFFLLEKQIFKSSKWGRPRDVYGTQLQDVLGTRWRDVLGTSAGRQSYMFF